MDKFCFGCARYWKEEVMTKVKRGKITRLMCQSCLDNKSGSWLKRSKTNDKKDS